LICRSFSDELVVDSRVICALVGGDRYSGESVLMLIWAMRVSVAFRFLPLLYDDPGSRLLGPTPCYCESW
jgi:hypothetical protein